MKELGTDCLNPPESLLITEGTLITHTFRNTFVSKSTTFVEIASTLERYIKPLFHGSFFHKSPKPPVMCYFHGYIISMLACFNHLLGISRNSQSEGHTTVLIITRASAKNRDDISCVFNIFLFLYAKKPIAITNSCVETH